MFRVMQIRSYQVEFLKLYALIILNSTCLQKNIYLEFLFQIDLYWNY